MSTRITMLKERAEAESKTAREVAQKAADEGREMTDDERHTYETSMKSLTEVLDGIKAVKADEAVMAQAKEFADSVGVAEKADIKARVKSLGLTVVDSPEFKSLLAGFPEGRVPSKSRVQSSPISVKSLFTGASSTSAGAFVINERADIVEMLGRKPLTIRSLVSNRRTTSDTVEFVAETSHTNNAAVVAEATSSAGQTATAGNGGAVTFANVSGGGYKPEGAWAFEVKTAVVKTIAEWVPVTKRALADVAQLEGLINQELQNDIVEAEEDQILNGDGQGENFTGITATSGIQTQAWATDLFTTIRKGVTKARTVGRVNPTALVLNPADAERIDLAQDGNGRYYYGGPQALGQRTIWGVPVVESESQATGTGLLGDFSKAVVWDREQTTVTMTDSHADFFIRNLVAVLAEERLAFGVTRPTAFVSLDLTA
ncbi:MAG TPA: phage major capsid protein [Mycobacterium sp.]|nr:phage major capsid protein [Mycobacterium sp.]